MLGNFWSLLSELRSDSTILLLKVSVYTISILESLRDLKSEGRMINRFGKVRLKFESAIISDGFCSKGYVNY